MDSRVGSHAHRGVGANRARCADSKAVTPAAPRTEAYAFPNKLLPEPAMVRGLQAAYIRFVRRHVMSRILAAVLSVWLVVCLAEPAQLHTCVMHGALAIDASHATHHAATHSAHTTAATVAKHSQPQKDGGHATQCTCLGDCSTGGTVVAVTASPISLASNTVEVPAAPFAYASPAIVAPQFLRPFSNGPPPASSRA
jgi:hypothetical protein